MRRRWARRAEVRAFAHRRHSILRVSSAVKAVYGSVALPSAPIPTGRDPIRVACARLGPRRFRPRWEIAIDMSESAAGRAAAIAKPNYRTTALIIASSLFMEQLDSTVLATALPTMARHFDVSPSHMSIALTSYLLSLAVLIPASGNLADRFGARTVFSSAIVIFTVGSVLCAQTASLPALVGARLLQGAGGAMMIPVGRLVLLRSVDKQDLVSAMGWFLVPAMTGPILGPPIGGLIVTYLDWRWIFYVNVPIGALGLVLTW